MNDVKKKLEQEMSDIFPTKHTELPWKVGNGGVIYTDDLRYLVAKLTNLDSNLNPSIEKANADFIVEACNMHYKLINELKAIRTEYETLLCHIRNNEAKIRGPGHRST